MKEPITVVSRKDDNHHKNSVVTMTAYVAFGVVHELVHLLAAQSINLYNDYSTSNTCWSKQNLFSILVDRQVEIHTDHMTESQEAIIRHAGWIVSLWLAYLVCRRYGTSSCVGLAAAITAAEAIATDLCGLSQLLPFGNSLSSSTATTFFCGNFGVLLLHHWWLTNKGKSSALDCLENMVNITMMRGAQSGGVVTYVPNGKNSMKAIRTRVVNGKRTDLSKQVRSKVEKTFSPKPNSDAVILAGHTRFATSSKASLEGTHPHRWSPGSWKRVYNWTTNQVEKKWVENYITHNGDFDFMTIQGQTYELETVQRWLSVTTGTETPAVVDSCAIAGVMDVLRAKGCFALAIRYALCFGNFGSNGTPSKMISILTEVASDSDTGFPKYSELENIGMTFEKVLDALLSSSELEARNGKKCQSLEDIEASVTARTMLAGKICRSISAGTLSTMKPVASFVDLLQTEYELNESDEEAMDYTHTRLFAFCLMTVNAFFDNDLFYSTKLFLENAKGSFGLSTSSTLDADHQICFAARGQTVSISFYPDKGIVCFGSEQAATKAGMNAVFDGKTNTQNHEWHRLDLDDLGGEIVVLDWGKSKFPVSKPNRHLPTYDMMDGKLRMVLHQESKSYHTDGEIYHRMTQLSNNMLIQPPKKSDKAKPDLVLEDINAIPNAVRHIQESWHSNNAMTGMNRLTAFSFSQCVRSRLREHVKGNIAPKAIDILLTGCEVSLWLAEQFAADLQKCFPKLNIEAISSNKLLGLFGQDLSIPATGFKYSAKTTNFNDAIVIIVSHSGGTFAPLACSNLLQSATRNIFVVTSEWDTQIGKQLRAMDAEDRDGHSLCRIFSTDIGVRPAEPCSVSVAATHQLLTNLFQYISVVVLSDPKYVRVSGALITEQDIKILERCNHLNIEALTEITGSSSFGYALDQKTKVQQNLHSAGDLWAEHILENARAYMMSFIYVFVTVTTGYPLLSLIASLSGLDMANSPFAYVVRFLDAALYFWLPQINITLIRLIQGRNLKHRMVGRTVVIGDIPWVAQSAEAFLSKIFAVSYSIAGVNVLSGNPCDHLVHRHTHRVVRGALAIFGRPDGRLSALSTSEATVCLSVNQASSIQSLGGTCESITIGHNPFKLDLSKNGIFLKRHRPLFLCERLLMEEDADKEKAIAQDTDGEKALEKASKWRNSAISEMKKMFRRGSRPSDHLGRSIHSILDCSISIKKPKKRSAPALLGAYLNIEESDKGILGTEEEADPTHEDKMTVLDFVDDQISSRKWSSKIREIFQSMDENNDGFLSRDEFIKGTTKLNPEISESEAALMFREADRDSSGNISIDEFTEFFSASESASKTLKAPKSHRDSRGIIQIEMSKEKYFGEDMRRLNAARDKKDLDFTLARSQHLCQELYESRIASLQRFVAMTVMFHHMGRRVENFFSFISFGLWGYRMDRTHSIMRIATTASPVSGADVRQRMEYIRLGRRIKRALDVISSAYLRYRKEKKEKEA